MTRISYEQARQAAKLSREHQDLITKRNAHSALAELHREAAQRYSVLGDRDGFERSNYHADQHEGEAAWHHSAAEDLAHKIRKTGGHPMGTLGENYDPTDEEDEAPDFDEEDVYDDLPDDETATRRAVLEDRRTKMIKMGNLEGAHQIAREISLLENQNEKFYPSIIPLQHAEYALRKTGHTYENGEWKKGNKSYKLHAKSRHPSAPVHISVSDGSPGRYSLATRKGFHKEIGYNPDGESQK